MLSYDELSELDFNRQVTLDFINADPVEIALIPRAETALPSGGTSHTDLAPRAIQRFRLIPMSHTEHPVVSLLATGGQSGVTRRHDFTLLGAWDAVMAKNDWWWDLTGARWTIDAMVPDNGYQRKALVIAFRGPHG